MNRIVFCIIMMVVIAGIGSAQFVPGGIIDPSNVNSPLNPMYHNNDNNNQPENNDKQIDGVEQPQPNYTPTKIPNEKKCAPIFGEPTEITPTIRMILIIVLIIAVIIYITGLIIYLTSCRDQLRFPDKYDWDGKGRPAWECLAFASGAAIITGCLILLLSDNGQIAQSTLGLLCLLGVSLMFGPFFVAIGMVNSIDSE